MKLNFAGGGPAIIRDTNDCGEMINAAVRRLMLTIWRWFFSLKINGASSGGVRFEDFPQVVAPIRPKNNQFDYRGLKRPFLS